MYTRYMDTIWNPTRGYEKRVVYGLIYLESSRIPRGEAEWYTGWREVYQQNIPRASPEGYFADIKRGNHPEWNIPYIPRGLSSRGTREAAPIFHEGWFPSLISAIYYEFFIYPSGLLYVHHNCGISKVINEAYLGCLAVGSSKKIS